MNIFSGAGELDVTGTTIYECPSNSPVSTITTLRFSNPAAYELTVALYKNGVGLTTLYILTLDAGDIISDPITYQLSPGDKLIAQSDITGTSYYAAITTY